MFSVHHICKPLTAQPNSLCATICDHLPQRKLADSCHGNSMLDVDVLIRSDYYWDLKTREIRRSESGPVAINTRLGWVLSSPVPPNRQKLSHHPTMSLIAAHTLKVNAESSDTHDLDDRLHSFWELGIQKTDKSVYKEFSERIRGKIRSVLAMEGDPCSTAWQPPPKLKETWGTPLPSVCKSMTLSFMIKLTR